jgi:hypothetical protein
MFKWKSGFVIVFAAIALTACGGGGGGGSTSSDTPVDTPDVSSSPSFVDVSGSVTFDSVPHNSATFGLDFESTTVAPARGVVVQAIDSNGATVDQAITDDEGNYSLTVDENSQIFVRARAEMMAPSGTASWEIAITDNTSGNALYALDTELFSIGTDDIARDLHAASGWDLAQVDYVDERAAAPFAILDSVYQAVQAFVDVDPTVQFPPLEIRWSENNVPSGDGSPEDLANGLITTSFYSPSQQVIYILGGADQDTDEFDNHVIVHEWGHYFEDIMSRADSLGGAHSIIDRLDMRLAFSEGFGNALSGIILGDSRYIDSFGTRQLFGFQIDVERNDNRARGWFNEASVQSILYDIFDGITVVPVGDPEASDDIEAGLAPIYDVLRSDEYVNSPLLTSIHLFLAEYLAAFPEDSVAISRLTQEQDITVNDAIGTGETNDGGNPDTLPIYLMLNQGQITDFCLTNQFGPENRLGNFRYILLEGLTAGNYTVRVERISGNSATDPDLFILQSGEFVAVAQSGTTNIEIWSGQLPSGDFVLNVFDFNRTEACYQVSFN